MPGNGPTKPRAVAAADPNPADLRPTSILDAHHPRVAALAAEIAGPDDADPVRVAVRLYRWVRDEIWYDPYRPFHRPEHYRSSRLLEEKRGFCIPKAGLLCALSRASGIPARVGFATVRNHLASRALLNHLGSDRFVFHGFSELFLNGRWVKATPTFNRELCERHRVPPLDFDGRNDAIFHACNGERKRFMEYLEDHGSFADIPVDRIVSAWEKAYGRERVRGWMADFDGPGTLASRRFEGEAAAPPSPPDD